MPKDAAFYNEVMATSMQIRGLEVAETSIKKKIEGLKKELEILSSQEAGIFAEIEQKRKALVHSCVAAKVKEVILHRCGPDEFCRDNPAAKLSLIVREWSDEKQVIVEKTVAIDPERDRSLHNDLKDLPSASEAVLYFLYKHDVLDDDEVVFNDHFYPREMTSIFKRMRK